MLFSKIELSDRAKADLEKALLKELKIEIYKRVSSRESHIEKLVKDKIKNELYQSPEVQNLLSNEGILVAELGVENHVNNIQSVIDYVIENIDAEIIENKNGFSIELQIKGGYQDLYSRTYSYYTTEKGVKIEWLRWLTEAGNQEIIFNYRVLYKIGAGRTGQAIMIPSKSQNWRVPPEYSGTVEDNFITRSFDKVESLLSDYIGGLLR